jgi:hypothetical protein
MVRKQCVIVAVSLPTISPPEFVVLRPQPLSPITNEAHPEPRTKIELSVQDVQGQGYDSFSNRCFSGHPFIPFREGEKNKPNPSGKGELWKRFYHFYKYNEVLFKQHHHKRSNVETVFSMMKAKYRRANQKQDQRLSNQ